MTRRDYIVVAEIISEVSDYPKRKYISDVIGMGLQARNSKFSVSKWSKACKVNYANTTK